MEMRLVTFLSNRDLFESTTLQLLYLLCQELQSFYLMSVLVWSICPSYVNLIFFLKHPENKMTLH